MSGVSSVRATGVLINCKLRDLDVWGDNCPLLCTGLVEPGKASQKPDRRYRTRCIFPVRMHVQVIFTPRAHARARGYVIGRGVHILYIVWTFFGTNLLSPKLLTLRCLF